MVLLTNEHIAVESLAQVVGQSFHLAYVQQHKEELAGHQQQWAEKQSACRKYRSRLTNQSMICLLQSLLHPQFLSKSIQIHDFVGINALVLMPSTPNNCTTPL